MVRGIDISASSVGNAERYAASVAPEAAAVESPTVAASRDTSLRVGIEFNPGLREPALASNSALQRQNDPMLQMMQQWTQFMTGMVQAMFGLVTRLVELLVRPQVQSGNTSTAPGTAASPGTGTPSAGGSTSTTPPAGTPTTQPPSTTTPPAATALNEVGSGFIWRSNSRRDKKLVVALPPGFRRNVASVRVVGADQRTELARSISSETGSNGRVRFRFDKPGAEFPAGSMVEVTMKSGEKKFVSIHHTGGEIRL